jgi:hypothetical protein
LNPIVKAKAKVAKLAKAKTVNVKSKPAVKAQEAEDVIETTRLQRIIEESVSHDDDVEDFNQILRDNGIEV